MIESGLKVTKYRNSTEYSTMYEVTLPDTFLFSDQFAYEVVRQIAEAVATKYVDEHYAEIAALLDQNAIANLAIADAGKKIAEEIQRRPNIFHETEHHTEIYQRGLLGGLRRVK